MSTQTATPARRRMSPRKRARMVRLAQYAVLVAVILWLVVTMDARQVQSVFLRPDLVGETLLGIPRHLLNTIIYTAGAFVVGLLLGTVLALMRLSQVAPYRWIAGIYIEFFRGVPAIIVFIAFGSLALAFPGLLFPFDPYGTVWAALGLVAAAYMAETIRAGIQAVPKGQVEAARSLGMPSGMALSKIVLPQAFRIVIPPVTNEFVLLLKDTSLLFIAGSTLQTKELTTFARDGLTTNANATPLVMAAMLYLLVTIPLTSLVARLERKMTKAR